MNGLIEQRNMSLTVPTPSTLMKFTITFTQIPSLFITHHKNDSSALQMDMLGYYVDTTGFKTNYFSGYPIDYIAKGY